MKQLKENNNGYSLVEMIICIAIVVILSGIAMVSISAIISARATAAQESFDEEIAALQARTKAQDKDNAIKLVRDSSDGKYYIYYGTSTNGTDFTPNSSDPDVTLDKVDIYYTYNGSAETLVTEQIFKFNKSDNYTINGYGTYIFYKSPGNSSVGRVTINKDTGSHYYGS